MFGFGLSGYIDRAKRFIAESMKAAEIAAHRSIDDFIPDQREVERIAEHCRKVQLSAEDCGLALIDAGYEFRQRLTEGVRASLASGGMPAEMQQFFEADAEGRGKAHDRLLTLAFEIGSTRYPTKVAPRFGTLGTAMSESAGQFLKSTRTSD